MAHPHHNKPTADDFDFGDLKQDMSSRQVAVRTSNPADGPTAWGVWNPDGLAGGHWAPYSEVADWKNT